MSPASTPVSALETALTAAPVIAILRSASARYFPRVAQALGESGVRAVEFTLNTPGALDALRETARADHPGLALGAGTVVTAGDAHRAVEAGATYLICPAACPEVVAEAEVLGVPVVPGAFTPTEVLAAWQGGAALVKLFPATIGGTEYVRALRGPFPDIPLVPTGGIGPANAAAYLAAGATALGVGGALLGDACEGGDLGALRDRAAALVAITATSAKPRASRQTSG